MMNFLMLLMLTISPATQTESLFIATDTIFNKEGILYLSRRKGLRFHSGVRLPGDPVEPIFSIKLPLTKN
jgi:hypothetical protein